MTTALVGLGICHVVTAAGLRPARTGGRLTLAIGGAATLAVAAFPQPAHGNAVAHTIAAAVAFIALAIWPVLASGRRADLAVLRRAASIAATLAMIALVLWFVAEVHGDQRGLAERAAAGAQSLWPLCVVASACVLQRRRKGGVGANQAPRGALVPEEQQ